MYNTYMRSTKRILVGIPVYNEAKYINPVLSEVCKYTDDVLVVDDGSNDLTPALLAGHPVEVIRHSANRGYGRSLQDMFRWAAVDKFDWLITMDCDEQHEPAAIPRFVQAILQDQSDIVSGSRYMELHPENDMPPVDRQAINRQITVAIDTAAMLPRHRSDHCNPMAMQNPRNGTSEMASPSSPPHATSS